MLPKSKDLELLLELGSDIPLAFIQGNEALVGLGLQVSE